MRRPALSSDAVRKIVDATDETITRLVLEAGVPVFVNFWAPWSVPSRTVEATLLALLTESAVPCRVVRVNVNDCPRTAEEFAVREIPAVVLCDGFSRRRLKKKSGIVSRRDLEKWISDLRARH